MPNFSICTWKHNDFHLILCRFSRNARTSTDCADTQSSGTIQCWRQLARQLYGRQIETGIKFDMDHKRHARKYSNSIKSIEFIIVFVIAAAIVSIVDFLFNSLDASAHKNMIELNRFYLIRLIRFASSCEFARLIGLFVMPKIDGNSIKRSGTMGILS